MGYAILRTQKLKSEVAVHRSMKHAFRAQETPNADASRRSDNTHIGAHSVAEGMAAFREALPEKRRKDAVLAIEYLVTASPEAMQGKTRQQQDAYFADALAWLRQRHGAGNVVYAGIHRDEQTPHMYAYVVPKDPDTGRLNCRRWLGGAKALSTMQTDFAQRVGQAHQLERGIEGSKARHSRVQRFYGALERPGGAEIEAEDVAPRVVKKGLFSRQVETPAAVAARLNGHPAVERGRVASLEARKAADLQREAQGLRQEVGRLKARLATVERVFAGLSREQVEKVLGVAIELKQQRQTRSAEDLRPQPGRSRSRSGPER
jgi:hypothetical protein